MPRCVMLHIGFEDFRAEAKQKFLDCLFSLYVAIILSNQE